MIHYTKVIEGVKRYIDSDLIQRMNGSYKAWIVGAVVTLYANRANQLIEELRDNPLIRGLHVIDGEMIDVDALYGCLLEQAQKRTATIDIPMIGAVTYSAADVEALYRMIMA